MIYTYLNGFPRQAAVLQDCTSFHVDWLPIYMCRPHAPHTNAKYQQISHLNFAVVKILQARLSPSSANPTLHTQACWLIDSPSQTSQKHHKLLKSKRHSSCPNHSLNKALHQKSPPAIQSARQFTLPVLLSGSHVQRSSNTAPFRPHKSSKDPTD